MLTVGSRRTYPFNLWPWLNVQTLTSDSLWSSRSFAESESRSVLLSKHALIDSSASLLTSRLDETPFLDGLKRESKKSRRRALSVLTQAVQNTETSILLNRLDADVTPHSYCRLTALHQCTACNDDYAGIPIQSAHHRQTFKFSHSPISILSAVPHPIQIPSVLWNYTTFS